MSVTARYLAARAETAAGPVDQRRRPQPALVIEDVLGQARHRPARPRCPAVPVRAQEHRRNRSASDRGPVPPCPRRGRRPAPVDLVRQADTGCPAPFLCQPALSGRDEPVRHPGAPEKRRRNKIYCSKGCSALASYWRRKNGEPVPPGWQHPALTTDDQALRAAAQHARELGQAQGWSRSITLCVLDGLVTVLDGQSRHHRPRPRRSHQVHLNEPTYTTTPMTIGDHANPLPDHIRPQSGEAAESFVVRRPRR